MCFTFVLNRKEEDLFRWNLKNKQATTPPCPPGSSALSWSCVCVVPSPCCWCYPIMLLGFTFFPYPYALCMSFCFFVSLFVCFSLWVLFYENIYAAAGASVISLVRASLAHPFVLFCFLSTFNFTPWKGEVMQGGKTLELIYATVKMANSVNVCCSSIIISSMLSVIFTWVSPV